MKWTFFFGAVVFLCFALLACTTAPGPSDDRFDKGSPLSSAGPSEIPVGTSTPAEPDAIQEIQGYSLKDAGLTITADQVFSDPNTDQKRIIWDTWHMEDATQEWFSVKRADYGGNLTFVTVETTESGIDYTSHVMFLLQCYRGEDSADGNTIQIQGEQVPVEELREKEVCEVDGWMVCDLTSYVLPEGFPATMEKWEQENPGDYDYQWTFEVYDAFKQNLSNWIQVGTASEPAMT